jgi:Zn-dependent protease with chaperone function
LTLRSIKSRLAREVTLGQRGVRWVYRWVIHLMGVYYYLSLPVVIFVVAAFVGVSICFLLATSTSMGRDAFGWWKPLTVITFVGMGLVAVRASFVRMLAGRVGRALEPEEAPRLFELARQVAEKVETRPLDEIRLVPSAAIAVVERGGFLARLLRRTRRVLILGVAALEGLTQGAFRALLAHEYGHFSHRDTAGGDTALRARLAMEQLLGRIQGLPGDDRGDPVFRFVRFYYQLYCRLTLGASRLQEILADRTSVTAYGPKAFEQGLRHVVRRSVEFDRAVGKLRGGGATASGHQRGVYDVMRQFGPEDRAKIEAEVHEAVHRPSTADDSHPSPQERLAIIASFDAVDPLPDERMAWELFDDAERIEGEMRVEG